MKTLENIIDYKAAPLVQWEPVIGEDPSPGKKREDILTHNAVVRELWRLGAEQITGIIADEARLELDVAALNSKAVAVTLLTLPGAFEAAAQNNVRLAVKEKRPNAEKVRVVTCIRESDDDDAVKVPQLRPGTQDVVVMNLILGCLATPEDHGNIHNILKFAGSLLRPRGSLVIVRPHPEGGKFETYECLTPAEELKAGDNYKFMVKGLEDSGAMNNLHTPDCFLKTVFEKAGFSMGATKPVFGTKKAFWREAPFLLNVCELR